MFSFLLELSLWPPNPATPPHAFICACWVLIVNTDIFVTWMEAHHKNVASIRRPMVRSWPIPIVVGQAGEVVSPTIPLLSTRLQSRPTISLLLPTFLPPCFWSWRAGSLWPPLTARMIEFGWVFSQLLSNWIWCSWTSIHLSRCAIEWVPPSQLAAAGHLVKQASVNIGTWPAPPAAPLKTLLQQTNLAFNLCCLQRYISTLVRHQCP